MYQLFFYLLGGHALADFGLRYDVESRSDTRFWENLAAHALMHGVLVTIITGSFHLGLVEVAAHGLIDFTHASGKISRALDQGLHIACKVLWIFLLRNYSL